MTKKGSKRFSKPVFSMPTPNKREIPKTEAKARETTPVQHYETPFHPMLVGECNECQRIFWVLGNYANHMRDVHGIEGVRSTSEE